MLHTITTNNQSTIDPTLISAQDAVLFWQNGVIIACQNNPILKAILQNTQNCFVLDNDINARNLASLIDPRVEIISMQQVVDLTVNYFPQMNWE
ncbi:sulfurtransferase complex subunit TusB [Gilliamella sp. ESL0443]|uniref:sulfurtransferase complex subunit TusB n=1 Tax=Gilliamella sp. ESL0443 TaxID=2704655 RepID=UPI001C6A5A59|nr:sulfurtransferase complex subunit TusB [Gilliamella sp. ESL0443]QYN41238.1 sulfurtransferase complex subunit TusB [Gilliamella sp. ESL0443]